MTATVAERRYKFTLKCERCNWSEHVFESYSCLTRQCYACPKCGNDHLVSNAFERKNPLIGRKPRSRSRSRTRSQEAVSDSEAETESEEETENES